MLILYNIGIWFFGLMVWIVSLFDKKAKQFVLGRKSLINKIKSIVNNQEKHIWFHFASLGEFEQGRPVLEQLKASFPDKKIIITFFSPSGYEIRKNYALAEHVFYLPLDTAKHAKEFIQAINPEMAIFTKYEYWYHYFKGLHEANTPLYIISGIFRPNQIFFKWYGSLNRKILGYVRHFFVQNEESKMLLASIQFDNVTISGDTRFDRVYQNAMHPRKTQSIEQFIADKNCMVAGSTWPDDETLLAQLITTHTDWKFIIAPHEISEPKLLHIETILKNTVRLSDFNVQTDLSKQILIIDSIGLLSSLYQYGQLAYIGGGFGAGIHNTLEAAAFGIPVIFGPKYQKFQEAKDLIALGAAISINNIHELNIAFSRFEQEGRQAGIIAGNYVQRSTGATEKILELIGG